MPSGRVIEPRAVRIVAHLLGAALDKQWDREGRQGAYDWRLRYPDSELAALEVTSHADRDLIELSVAMERQGDEIPAPILKHRWELWLADDVYRRAQGYKGVKGGVQTVAPAVLARLEAMGISYFERPEYGSARPEIEPLTSLGIAFGGSRQEPGSQGAISLFPPEGVHGAIRPSLVLNAAMQELKANRDKLGRADTKERHLLVWIDGSAFFTWMGLDNGRPPDEVPELGEEVTTLWIAGRHRNGQASVVWRVGPQPSWESFVVSDAETEANEHSPPTTS